MAFLFIKINDEIREGETLDRISSFKAGDIVEVLDSLEGVADCNGYPIHYIIEIKGKTKAELDYLRSEDIFFNPTIQQKVVQQKRKYKFDFGTKLTVNQIKAMQESKTWAIPEISVALVEEKTL